MTTEKESPPFYRLFFNRTQEKCSCLYPALKKIQIQPQVKENAQLIPPCCLLNNKHKTEKLSFKKKNGCSL